MMKRYVAVLFCGLFFMVNCGKESSSPLYSKDSNEYIFFRTLCDSLQISVLNPDKSNELIRTQKFSIWTPDIMDAIYMQLGRYDINTIPKAEMYRFIRETAKQEAEKRLLLLAAEENRIVVTEDTLEATLELYYQNSGGKEQFLQQIAERGFTFDYVKEDIKSNLLIQNYIQDEVYSAIDVTDEEIQIAYQQGDSVAVRHILMNTQGKSQHEVDEIYAKMEDILQKARSGEDFAELAKTYSEDSGSKNNGGFYKKFPRGQMVKPFEDASFGLPVGSISDIVKTQYGYHIIKIIDRGNWNRPLEEVRDEIENTLRSSKRLAAIVANLESLKRRYQYEELVTF